MEDQFHNEDGTEIFENVLRINKVLHGKGDRIFNPEVNYITEETFLKLINWCENRYENFNACSRGYIMEERRVPRLVDYNDYIGFILDQLTPRVLTSDAHKYCGSTKNGYNCSYSFGIFELLWYISKELGLDMNELEFSDEYINKIIEH